MTRAINPLIIHASLPATRAVSDISTLPHARGLRRSSVVPTLASAAILAAIAIAIAVATAMAVSIGRFTLAPVPKILVPRILNWGCIMLAIYAIILMDSGTFVLEPRAKSIG